MDARIIGNTIAVLRKSKGMTQKELAQALHVTDKAVSKWERGANFPDLTLLEPLARQLDISVAALLSLEDASPQETIESVSEISAAEKEKVRRELRRYAFIKIGIAVCLDIALIYISKTMYDHGIFGRAQNVVSGMIYLVAILLGAEVFLLRNISVFKQ